MLNFVNSLLIWQLYRNLQNRNSYLELIYYHFLRMEYLKISE